MNIELFPARDLPAEALARWHEIQCTEPALASPYFRPEFVRIVAEVRGNVEVAVLREAEEIVGIFPFERHAGVVARPVGGRLSDYQGVICRPGLDWSVPQLLAGCRLKAWEFDHQIASQAQLAPYFERTAFSPTIDLSEGHQAWLARRREVTTVLTEPLRKLRKLQREHDIRFEWNTPDEATFQQMMVWKTQQYHRTGIDDLFASEWIVRLLRTIWRTDEPHFGGALCAMYAGERLVAAHFNMRTGCLLHSWFPSYDHDFGKYSPGMALLLLMAQHAPERGITAIDLGKGDEDYKLALADKSVPLGEGVVDTRILAPAMRTSWRKARDWVKQTPLRGPAKASLRWLRSIQAWMGATP